MALTTRKPAIAAEAALLSLKNCLVNLPASLVSVLNNADAAAQDVVIELQYRPQPLSSAAASQKSAYVGWTGMPSRRRPSPLIGTAGHAGKARQQELPSLEIDEAFAHLLEIADGQRVGIYLHLEPPVAHTVNIEPFTPSDWEVIELHANFLELNLLSQVRALPNPTYFSAGSVQAEHSHPLTLHLSPTSTAKVIVTSLTPPAPNSSPFAKIAPDAEVIVAPKMRPKSSRGVREDDRSITSTGRRSAKSGGSSVRPKSTNEDVLFLRGLDRSVCDEWFPLDAGDAAPALHVWVHPDTLLKEALKGRRWVTVSIVRPAGLRAQLDQHQMQQLKEQESAEAGLPATKVVARLGTWVGAPDEQHVALSATLCSILGFEKIVGCITRLEAAPSPLQRSELKSIKLHPFLPNSSSKREGFSFGGESKMSNQALTDRVKNIYGAGNGLLLGPISDGMLLPASEDPRSPLRFGGGIIRLEPSSGQSGEKATAWLSGSEHNLILDLQSEIPRTMSPTTIFATFDSRLPEKPPDLVGINPTIKECLTNLGLCSSLLLTGGIGSGKTALAHFLCHRLRQDHLFNTTYFSCRELVTDETRVSSIKDTLTRLFMSASWCARLSGHAVVVLDDLDKICPVETELQIGNDNGRSRLITEILCSIVRYYCGPGSSIALLATARSKESLNHLIVSGHVVGDIISLTAPNKEGRRQMLTQLLSQDPPAKPNTPNGHRRNDSNSTTPPDGFTLSPSLDLLSLAGRTDGFMPADLKLLVSRARTECLTRTLTSPPSTSFPTTPLTLTPPDFTLALQNLTPSSLRHIPLTHPSTPFTSIGGLHHPRATLLETLHHPTKYAPIFASSPLRLRSGLLLYGYPGCGKTLLASAIATETQLNFISVKGPEILNKYIGASEKSVRDLFSRAQAARPCVLFFDEFDSVAPKRGHDSTGVTDRVVNQLLTQMDGAEGLEGVYVLAATSRPDLIDPALLRPGRLDKSLLCDLPDRGDRVEILRAVSGKLALGAGVRERLDEVAARTEGFSGADLQALMYNAHLEAVHAVIGAAGAIREKEAASSSNGVAPLKRRGGKRESSHLRRTRDGDTAAADRYALMQFLQDPDADAAARASKVGTAFEAPALVAERLAGWEMVKERRRLRKGRSAEEEGDEGGEDKDEKKEKGEVVVTVRWEQVETALRTTRRSISEAERRRLEAIYREFVVGRNGEVGTGEGDGTQVGARSSLM